MQSLLLQETKSEADRLREIGAYELAKQLEENGEAASEDSPRRKYILTMRHRPRRRTYQKFIAIWMILKRGALKEIWMPSRIVHCQR